MFSFIKQKLQKIYTGFTSKLGAFFGRAQVDEATLHELEQLLIAADTGVKPTRSIIEQLKRSGVSDGNALRMELESILISMLRSGGSYAMDTVPVYLLVGINGSGKTTCVAKLAYHFKSRGKKVLLVAADTFRAAAQEQLTIWASHIGVDIICGTDGQDPSAVVFRGCEQFKTRKYDILIIDTAGRLQTKTNLMHELAKVRRVVGKVLADTSIATLLTIDAMLGQNSFEQAKLFTESAPIDGIVLTKMDGTGKGGIVFAIADQLRIPVAYITFGEQLDQLKRFDAREFVHDLLNM